MPLPHLFLQAMKCVRDGAGSLLKITNTCAVLSSISCWGLKLHVALLSKYPAKLAELLQGSTHVSWSVKGPRILRADLQLSNLLAQLAALIFEGAQLLGSNGCSPLSCCHLGVCSQLLCNQLLLHQLCVSL